MFNAPRPTQARAGVGNFGASFVDENPLASSVVYDDGLDPWSAAPSPSPPTLPTSSSSGTGSTQLFNSVIADAIVPRVYQDSFNAVDPTNSGETSVNSLSRVLATSGLPATTIEKIVSLVSSRPRVSKLEFFVALALVALSQSGKAVSVEQVAKLAEQNTLPEPSLDLSSLSAAPSTFSYNRTPSNPVIRSSAPAYSSDDPWSTQSRGVGNVGVGGPSDAAAPSSIINGAPSSVSGTGMPRDWWKKQERVQVNFLGQQGFILNRYMVYEVVTDRGAAVPRRYSEFVFLFDCLVRRYPFRIIPQLPPKRIGPDENFLEQRRKGLQRFLYFVINHPVIKEDGLLSVFLTEPSLEQWRKHTSISLEEESASKRVDRVEEMSIPSDLEEKLGNVRGKIVPLIEAWQKISILAERIIRKREAAAADLARLTNTFRVLVEVNGQCWRGEECELSDGVKRGLTQVSEHTQRETDLLEQRTRILLNSTLEGLKSQRDLYIAMRDLFIRHDRLSVDQVERLKKRVETTSVKLEGIRAVQKEGWQDEADKLSGAMEKDKVTITAQLNRRVFIRACMWHELRVVLHNRENTLLTQLVQSFSREEQEYADSVAANWASLAETVESMPLE